MSKASSKPPVSSSPVDSPLRTRTLPESQRGAWFEGADPVTMLSVYGTALTFELPLEKTTFTIGSSPDRDIAIPTGFLSALHCVLERRAGKLRVHDQGSYNGTYFQDRRESTFEIRPGDTFIAGSIRFLTWNDVMRAAHSSLVELLGAEDERTLQASNNLLASPSDVLVAATKQGNILITGELGCDHERLARTIHQVSLLRDRPAVTIDRVPEDRAAQRDILDRAARSTLIIPVVSDTPLIDAAFASMMFSPHFHIRVIVFAPSINDASRMLGDVHTRDMRLVFLQPLARRRDMILRLLDAIFSERGIELRTHQLTSRNQAALEKYDWPRNLDELRAAAERIAALARTGSIRRAAVDLGMTHSTLHYWMTTVGLSKPLVEGRDGHEKDV